MDVNTSDEKKESNSCLFICGNSGKKRKKVNRISAFEGYLIKF